MPIIGDWGNVYKIHKIDNDTEEQWIEKTAELAKKKGLKIKEIEEYQHGRAIRFAETNNPSSEADIYVWYKRVVWLSESSYCGLLRAFTANTHDQQVSSLLGSLGSCDEIIPGYTVGMYDGLSKDVETPEDAADEVFRIMPLRSRAGSYLDGIVRDVEQWIKKRDVLF